MLALRGSLLSHSMPSRFQPPPTPPSSTRLCESTLLSSDLTAAVTNYPNRFTFGGIIAECVKTVFAP